AVFANHLASKVSCNLEVILRAGAHLTEYQLLGAMPTQRRGDAIRELGARPESAIFSRKEPRVPAHHSVRNDRNLVHRIMVLQEAPDDRVARLMVGSSRLLSVGDNARLSLRPGHHTINGIFHLSHADGWLIAAR